LRQIQDVIFDLEYLKEQVLEEGNTHAEVTTHTLQRWADKLAVTEKEILADSRKV